MQSAELTKATIKDIIFAHTVTIPYHYFLVWPFFAWKGIDLAGPLPSISVAALQIVGAMLVEDTLFYWSHRMLHHPLLYKHIHKQHHQYKYTVSYAAEYSHVVEATLSNVIPTYAGPFLFNMHLGVMLLWIALRMWETADGHSG